MARRAGVVPFSLSNVTVDVPGHRTSPTHSHSHSHSQGSAHSHSQSVGSISSLSGSSTRYSRPSPVQAGSGHHRGSSVSSARVIVARTDSTPRSVPITSPTDGLALAAFGTGLPTPRGSHFLPSVAEMTTGMGPYTMPAYATSGPSNIGPTSPGPLLPSLGAYSIRTDMKRRASPDIGIDMREAVRRRQ